METTTMEYTLLNFRKNAILGKCLFLLYLQPSSAFADVTISPAQNTEVLDFCTDPHYPDTFCDNRSFFRITGRLENGNAAEVERLLGSDRIIDIVVPIFLDFDGGSTTEGIRLAQFFASHGYVTVISDGSTCLSACAISFLGGSSFSFHEYQSRRFLHVGGTIGFHAPELALFENDISSLLQQSDGDQSEAVSRILQITNFAYDAAIMEISLLSEISNLGNGYLPQVLLDKIVTTSPSTFWFVESVFDAHVVNAILYGVSEEHFFRDDESSAFSCLNSEFFELGAPLNSTIFETTNNAYADGNVTCDSSCEPNIFEGSAETGGVMSVGLEIGAGWGTCEVRFAQLSGALITPHVRIGYVIGEEYYGAFWGLPFDTNLQDLR